MAGKFEVYKDKKGEFRFRLKSANGEIILASEGYKDKSGAMNGVQAVKKNADLPPRPSNIRRNRRATTASRASFTPRRWRRPTTGRRDEKTTAPDFPSDESERFQQMLKFRTLAQRVQRRVDERVSQP